MFKPKLGDRLTKKKLEEEQKRSNHILYIYVKSFFDFGDSVRSFFLLGLRMRFAELQFSVK